MSAEAARWVSWATTDLQNLLRNKTGGFFFFAWRSCGWCACVRGVFRCLLWPLMCYKVAVREAGRSAGARSLSHCNTAQRNRIHTASRYRAISKAPQPLWRNHPKTLCPCACTCMHTATPISAGRIHFDPLLPTGWWSCLLTSMPQHCRVSSRNHVAPEPLPMSQAKPRPGRISQPFTEE